MLVYITLASIRTDFFFSMNSRLCLKRQRLGYRDLALITAVHVWRQNGNSFTDWSVLLGTLLLSIDMAPAVTAYILLDIFTSGGQWNPLENYYLYAFRWLLESTLQNIWYNCIIKLCFQLSCLLSELCAQFSVEKPWFFHLKLKIVTLKDFTTPQKLSQWSKSNLVGWLEYRLFC